MIGKGRLPGIIQLVIILLATAALLLPFVLADQPWPVQARNYLEGNAGVDTGARNTVSAIYLGYRVFDTLGETIVLLVAITGTIALIGKYGINQGAVKSGRLRTVLLEVVAAKLGPIVLVFGLYVMMYGHVSPGGGFQGGVVIASGIIFLELGGRKGASTMLADKKVLALIESSVFLLMVLSALSGVVLGGGFFADFLAPLGMPTVSYIVMLNILIGMKVGAGIGYMCISMLGRVE